MGWLRVVRKGLAWKKQQENLGCVILVHLVHLEVRGKGALGTDSGD